MWKIILLALTITTVKVMPSQDSNHSSNLKKQFPYTVLNNDFGILSLNDLAVNSCVTEAVQFSEDSHAFPYWQCFNVKDSIFKCENVGKYENSNENGAILSIKIQNLSKNYVYLSRRAILMSTCKSFKKDWIRLTLNQKNVCLSGPFGFFENTESKQPNEIWTFDKFKTKKGCSSFFKNGARSCFLMPRSF
jgi:hypothetical protein